MIYNMSCIEGSQQHLEDESVDLMVTDPPYKLGYGGTGFRKVKKEGFGTFANDELSDDDYRQFTADWLREAYRVLKPGRHIYVCIDWRQYPLLFWLMQHIGFTIKNCIVWDKVHMGMGWQYRYRHEFVIFAVKDVVKRRRAPRQPGLPAKTGSSPLKNRRVSSRSITDIWKVTKVPANKMVHPTEKPVELITPMILQSSQEGELVVDFFVGSGPVYEAAISNGRLFKGFELSPYHCQSAMNRIQS
ncbi:DNA-methyltransferase [Paenibacillus sp. NRS-1783]|uniref:DNA-methyltransferase n=1 Tax=Paenibacillus sp. NRS-1783 TaxID=3233907 RepID=UPI003D2B3B12